MQAAHQVFRKYETYNIAVHAAILFAPPILLTLLVDSPQSTLLRNFATYLTTLVLSVLVYRISPIHPLARYPGPIGCKISKFWLGFVCIPGFQHQYIKSLHERYGDVVRIGALSFAIPGPIRGVEAEMCFYGFGYDVDGVLARVLQTLGNAEGCTVRLSSFPS